MDSESFSGRLLPGERILWSGRPATGLLFTGRDFFLVPFSLLWGGFAIFWEATVAGVTVGAPQGSIDKMPVFFLLFGGAFVCVGLYFIFGRFIVDAWLRSATRYAVSDQRILIARSGPLANFTAISLDRVPEVQLRSAWGGRNTILFGSQTPFWMNRNFGAWSPAMDPTPQFLAIDDGQRVFDLIQTQKKRIATPS